MPKSVSNLNVAEDPSDLDLLYVSQTGRTPKDRKLSFPTAARAFLSRLLTHPTLSWAPGGDPLMVMARKGTAVGNDSVGLFDLQAIYKDTRTDVINIAIAATPLGIDMGGITGNARIFITATDPSPKIILSNNLIVGHTLIIHASGATEPIAIEYPSGTPLYSLQPGQTFTLGRGQSGYSVYVEGVAPLPAKTTLVGDEWVKLEEPTGEWKKATTSLFLPTIIDVPAGPIVLTKYDNGVDIDLATLGVLDSYVKVAVTPNNGFSHGSLKLSLDGRSASTSNANPATFNVPSIPAYSPFTGWLTANVAHAKNTGDIIHDVLPVLCLGNRFDIYAQGGLEPMTWAQLSAYNDRDIAIEINVTRVLP